MNRYQGVGHWAGQDSPGGHRGPPGRVDWRV